MVVYAETAAYSRKKRYRRGNTMSKVLAGLFIAPFIIGVMMVPEAPADQSLIEDFLGDYQGVSVDDPSETWLPADLDVSIRPHENGFILKWATITKGGDGKIERHGNAVKFHPTKRHNVYAAAMRPDLFGGWIPLDPFKGDPFMWARYLDSTLTVYSMTITDTGAHDMRLYERTLSPDGLSIKFKRLHDEKPLQVVNGILKRVK